MGPSILDYENRLSVKVETCACCIHAKTVADPGNALNFSFNGNYSLHSLPLGNASNTKQMPVHSGPYFERKGFSPLTRVGKSKRQVRVIEKQNKRAVCASRDKLDQVIS